MKTTAKNFLSQFDPKMVRAQYAKNAKQLRDMAEQSKTTGTFRGLTTEQLNEKANYFDRLSKEYK